MYHIVAYLQVGVYHVTVIEWESELPEYVRYATCIKYKIESCYTYLTIPVWIETKDIKPPSSTYVRPLDFQVQAQVYVDDVT